MKTLFTIGAALVSLVASTQASATSFTFVTNANGGTTASPNAYGNARTYEATAEGKTLKVKATAWTMDSKVSSAYLGSYTGTTAGLGALNQFEGDGSDGLHTVDNLGRNDFILLQFSQAVTLTAATLNAWSVAGYTPDNDATISWGTLAGAWDQSLSLAGKNLTQLGALFAGSVDIEGNGKVAARSITGGGSGNLWLVGAAQFNPDCDPDGFKLAGFTVTTPTAAVPEPATWAMMLVGFGMVGATTRYRRRRTTAQLRLA